jgi:hypothetical protein
MHAAWISSVGFAERSRNHEFSYIGSGALKV